MSPDSYRLQTANKDSVVLKDTQSGAHARHANAPGRCGERQGAPTESRRRARLAEKQTR